MSLLAPGLARADDTFTTSALQHEHNWTVPDGVTAATVSMFGARGGGGSGRGGDFRATLAGLSPGASMAVCLGGQGALSAPSPSFPPFGAGAMGGGSAPLGGYGGGGATDVRLSPNCFSSADKRLLVAGGGGGQGTSSADGSAGGRGGSPGSAATNGAPYRDGFGFVVVTGGSAGGGGSAANNGGGGAGGTAASPGVDVADGSDGSAGAIGSSGTNVGGRGGEAGSNGGSGGIGGGGGGGYFAGGGGGGGGFFSGGLLSLTDPGGSGGGGGGAGSNCLGLSGGLTCAGTATPITSVNRLESNVVSFGNGDGAVVIWYPNVSISSPAESTTFEGNAAASASFACSVDEGPPIQSCNATVTKPDGSTQTVVDGDSLPTGGAGSYSLSVTAVDSLGGTRRLTRTYTVEASYPRPMSASPLRVPLVPAYDRCTAPNFKHGPSLEYFSCAPPAQTSSQLTVGTADANGQPPNSTGFAKFQTLVGNPGTPEDEADVRVSFSLSDVREQSGLGDYAGNVTVRAGVRITDEDGPATLDDLAVTIITQCSTTPSSPPGNPSGSQCSVTTTFDTLTPGLVDEGARAIWQLSQIEVRDDNGNVFARQGVFVP